jgi:hypothetical protein
LLTKNGQLHSFATSLVDDAHSRALRALVDSGYLTYEYTGTQRVYTLTEACGSKFPVRVQEKTVAKKNTEEATNGQVEEGRNEKAADSPAEEKSKIRQKNHEDPKEKPAAGTAEQKRKIRQKSHDAGDPIPKINNDEPHPIRARSKAHAALSDAPQPTLPDLLAVGEIAAQHGGAKKLLAQVSLVDDLARKVGGIDRLRLSLEGLETLAKLFK